MMFDHITATACQECGSKDIRGMEKANKHCNGQWNERLTFGCGLKLHYSPNFQRVEVEGDCTKSDAYLAWKEKRDAIGLAMVKAAKKAAGVPESADLWVLERSLRSDLDRYRDVLDAKPK